MAEWIGWILNKTRTYDLYHYNIILLGQLPGTNIGSNCQWDWSQKEYTDKSFQCQLKEDSLVH